MQKRTGTGACVLWAAVIAAVVLSAGCARDEDNAKVIRVTRNIGGREGFRLHFRAWREAFERDNPGWKIELIDLGNQNGDEFYKARIATGDLPEVVMTWQLTPMLVKGNHLVPLDEAYYEKFGIPPPRKYKGRYYTTQGGIQVQGIAVNKKMWADVGVTTPPQTWDEFVAGLAKLKAKGHRPLVFGGREWSAFQPLFYAIATNMYDRAPSPDKPSWTIRRNKGEVRFATDPTARLILGKMIHLLDNFVPKGAASDGYDDEQRIFYGGKGAAWMMGCWIAGDIEANKVNFEIDYWPIPSMTGRKPVLITCSGPQSGWAMTTSATGEKRAKARAFLESFYKAKVYQLFLNGEGQFAAASKVPVKGPQSAWGPAQTLFDNIQRTIDEYGTTPGFHIALDDIPPPIFFSNTVKAVMQEMLAGTRDVDKLLKMLDDDWDSALKGM